MFKLEKKLENIIFWTLLSMYQILLKFKTKIQSNHIKELLL